MLRTALFLALFDSFITQDLFVGNFKLDEATTDKELKDKLLDIDPKLRGYIHQLLLKGRSANTASSSASTPTRVLVADGGEGKSMAKFTVRITFFGELGFNEKRSFDERRELAQRWLLPPILKSSLTSSRMTMDLDLDIDQMEKPEAHFAEVEPFAACKDCPGGEDRDQRSPMKRSMFTFTFNLMEDAAQEFATNFCQDYQDNEEVLLAAFLRALETSDMYPEQGMKAAAVMGCEKKSVIHPEAHVVRDSTEVFSCAGSGQWKPTSDHGALYLPDCPEHATHCLNRPDLCTEEENREKPWMCKCQVGYAQDNLELVGTGNMDKVTQRFEWTGKCDKIPGYCPLRSVDDQVMILQDGTDALGVIYETARPRCGDGYKSTGYAVCMDTSAQEGTWLPSRRCKYDAPSEPPVPLCEEPQTDESMLATDCRYCRAGHHPWLSEGTCHCQVQCAPGYKRLSGGEEGSKKCLSIDLREECPAQDSLEWLPSDPSNPSCRNKADGQFVNDFCCNEAWGPNLPKELQSTRKCTELTKDADCLSSYQEDSGAPCCWNENGYHGGSADSSGPQCAARGDSNFITKDPHTQPEACAVEPGIPGARWEDFPNCVAKCENVFAGHPALEISSGCDNCVPGVSCDCHVKCKGDYVWTGGGIIGEQTCSKDTGRFGQLPLCLPPEPAPICASKLEPVGYNFNGCEECRAGSSSCVCEVNCAPGYKRVGLITEGEKQCNDLARDLSPLKCEDIDDRDTCLGAKSLGGQQQVPCCWRTDGFGPGKEKKCVPTGSPLMDIGTLPEKCADQRKGAWADFPVCEQKCKNIFIGIRNVVETDPCDECVASEPENCPCSVKCKEDGGHVGGGKVGKRTCSSGDGEPSFGDVPVCAGKGDEDKFKHPEPPICSPPSDRSLDVRGCRRCTAGGSCDDGCSVSCAKTYLQTTLPSTNNEGSKACHWDARNDLQEAICKELTEERQCINAVEKGSPCCYREQGLWSNDGSPQKCAALGDNSIKELPDECTSMKKTRWDEMPTCARRCEHQFSDGKNLDWKASECTNVCFEGGECSCEVKCAKSYERIGGGEEGKRCCGASATCEHPAMDITYMMDDPPFCVHKENLPFCDPSAFPKGVVAHSCDRCVAGKDCPSCQVKCDSGYTHSKGDVGGNTCKLVENPEVQEVDSCEGIKDFETCTRSYESYHTTKKTACCYRQSGFVGKDVVCLAKHSRKLNFRYPPDQCAVMHAGEWEHSLTCVPACPNIFKRLANINQNNIDKCDHCVVGTDCDCNVECVTGTVRVPDSGAEGSRQCLASGSNDPLRPSFGDPPECLPVCSIPSHEHGTRDLSNCTEVCFPGRWCDCKVYCAAGVEANGGGPEGLVRCLRTSQDTAAFVDLPKCSPVCEPPKDACQTLDARGCRARCLPDDKDCNCELKCKSKPSEGGGPEGRKICMFVPGGATTPATAKWVSYDKDNTQEGWDMLPNCAAPIVVRVLGATNQQPISNALVLLVDLDKMQEDSYLPQRKETNENGDAEFNTDAERIIFSVSKDGYSPDKFEFDRNTECDCETPECFVQSNINKELATGDINSDGCFFTANPGQVHFEMQATLNWNSFPKDLDLWVRNVNCAENTRKQYQCWDDGDFESKGSQEDKLACQRSKFVLDETRDLEKQACRVKKCMVYKNPQRTKFNETDDRGRVPDCRYDFANQFPKWVYWKSQFVDRLAHRIVNGEARKIGGLEDWTDNHYIVLETDQTDGNGPETVTFRNVPPGTYQVVVHQYSRKEGWDNIKYGHPYINLFLGGNNIKLRCSPDDSCKNKAYIWNAFNIRVEDMNQIHENGQRKYSVRIIDQEDKMAKLHPKQIPTGEQTYSEDWWTKKYVLGDMLWIPQKHTETYYQTFVQQTAYLEYNTVCYGTCKLQSDDRYKGCLERHA